MSKALGLTPYPSLSSPRHTDRPSHSGAIPQSSKPSGVAANTARQEPPALVPATLGERLALARLRLMHAAENGIRIRVYEVALDLDMSEFHFARQFRAAFNCSPHVYYDEVRAAQARRLLQTGVSPGQAARAIGLRRPAELRALLVKRCGLGDHPETHPRPGGEVARPSAFEG